VWIPQSKSILIELIGQVIRIFHDIPRKHSRIDLGKSTGTANLDGVGTRGISSQTARAEQPALDITALLTHSHSWSRAVGGSNLAEILLILLLKDVGSYKVSDFSLLCSFTGGNMNHQELVESLLLCFPNDTPSSLSARLRLYIVIRRYSKFWGGQRNHQPNDDFPTNLSFRSLYLDYIGYESNHWVPRNGISQGTVACPTICWSGCRRDVGCSKRNQLSVLLSGRGSTMMASLARGETPRSLDITMMARPYRAGGRKLNENDFKSINEHATQICKDWGCHMIYMMSFQGLHHQTKHG